jgi:2-C-methyl-D-erythritol 4-phosphate cytidylyltransferase
MSKKVYAIITAGGSGARFSEPRFGKLASQKPKQFLNLLGKPVILYSMLVFQKCSAIDEIIISSGKEYFDYIHTLAAKHKIKKLTGLVEGGKTRFASVKNAFMSIENPGKKDIVLIHDAARPNINVSMVEGMLDLSYEVIAGTKITETVKRDKKGFVSDTLNRENLWRVQTPQVFRYGILSDSYKKCGGKNDFTDEASLVEYAGHKVKIIEGLRDNIKITTPDDIDLLKRIMK